MDNPEKLAVFVHKTHDEDKKQKNTQHRQLQIITDPTKNQGIVSHIHVYSYTSSCFLIPDVVINMKI